MATAMTSQPGADRSKEGEKIVSIALVGMTGSGKSATGNTILSLDPIYRDKKPFASSPNPMSVTQRCDVRHGSVLGQDLAIVDTPGFKDTKKSYRELFNEIAQITLLLAPGPHIILLIVRMTRMTGDVIDALKQAKKMFGTDLTSFTILVFTEYDTLEFDGVSLESWLESMNPDYKALIEECDGRYIAFNNRLKDLQSIENQVKPLMDMISGLKRQNNGARYTNDIFTRAEQIMMLTEREIRGKKDEVYNLQMKIDQLQQALSQENQQRRAIEKECENVKKDKETLELFVRKLPDVDNITELAKYALKSKEGQRMVKEVTNKLSTGALQVGVENVQVTGCKCC